MASHSTAKDSRLFYGWLVVAAAFTVTFVGFGSAYTFSAFVEPMQQEFAASRGSVSLVFSLAGFLYFALGVVTGPLADRWGSRPLAVIGMLLIGVGLVAAGAAQSLTQMYLAYGLGIGLGIGFSYVPAVGAVQRWFTRRRGLASGLAVSGIGVGTLVLPPLAAVLIEAVGWRQAYVVLGLLAAVIGVSMSLFIENDPSSRGLGADGDAPIAVDSTQPASGHSIFAALRSRRFLGLYAACLISSFGMFVPFAHLVPYALDHGLSASTGAVLLGMIGVGSTVGRFFLGGVADRVGRQTTLVAMFAGMGLSMLIWLFATSFLPLAVFALVYGIVYGGGVSLLPAIVMDYFGGRNVSGIIGILYTSVAFGTLIGPTGAGFAYDRTQSYSLAILAVLAVNLIAAVIVHGLGNKRALSAAVKAADGA